MEGAQALEVAAAGVAELEVFGDDGVDRDRVPYRLHVLVIDPAGHVGSLRRATDGTAGQGLGPETGR
ncbi:hypothetical protein SCA03_36530 [Streptomyces cacaoi]|uniref:Uncharacterized protein n=1 Tax=Streptomyces cacaoi TaxID=1898 RepID=A0A4Y3R0S9_STRCI|nr:hypothetical protein SCA03_36530 [Streptomyces cacaoi]